MKLMEGMPYSSFLPVTEAGRAADTLPASSSYLVLGDFFQTQTNRGLMF